MKLPPKFRNAVNRRHFLSFLGTATIALLGLPKRLRAAPSDQWDLIVVGGGNAGLPAAIFAAQRGARVLIIEAAGILGGTLHMSSGQMAAAGTKLQESKGIEDSPQSHYDDIMRISKNTADPELVRLAVFNAAETFDWLMDGGFDVNPNHPITGTTHEPYSSARYARGQHDGRSILKILLAQLQPEIDSGRVTVALGTEVTELIQNSAGAVTAVMSRSQDGEISRHNGHNVLLTCGGYASNPEMFEKLEGAKDYSNVSYPFSQGAGITLGQAVGGYIRGGEHHLPLFGGVMVNDNYPSVMIANARHFPPNRPPWEIFVNRDGERFLREDIPSHDAYEHALLEQPEERCWVVFDDAILKQAPQLLYGGFTGSFDTLAAFNSQKPFFFRSDSLPSLAVAAGIDPGGLEKTVASYNAGQQSGKDALGREHMPLPIGAPPYYAIQLQSWLLTTYAGLAVDKDLRVIRADKTPIKGLYAAGELLGGGQFMGRSYCGGMLVTPALTLGRLLGQSILEFPA